MQRLGGRRDKSSAAGKRIVLHFTLFQRCRLTNSQLQGFQEPPERPLSPLGREIVHIMPGAQTAGQLAAIQAQRDNKDCFFWFFEGDIEDLAQFLLDIAFFRHRAARNADDDRVAGFHSLFDLQVPVLAGQQLFLVQPRFDPVLTQQAPVQLADQGFILRGMAEKHAQAA